MYNLSIYNPNIRRTWTYWSGSRKDQEMIGGFLLRKRLNKLGFVSLEKRRLWAELITALQYSKEVYKKDGDSLISRTYSKRTREHGFKLRL